MQQYRLVALAARVRQRTAEIHSIRRTVPINSRCEERGQERDDRVGRDFNQIGISRASEAQVRTSGVFDVITNTCKKHCFVSVIGIGNTRSIKHWKHTTMLKQHVAVDVRPHCLSIHVHYPTLDKAR